MTESWRNALHIIVIQREKRNQTIKRSIFIVFLLLFQGYLDMFFLLIFAEDFHINCCLHVDCNIISHTFNCYMTPSFQLSFLFSFRLTALVFNVPVVLGAWYVVTHPFKSLSSGVPITSLATSV